MRLDAVVKGKIDQPMRLTMMGPEGVGKSTFGANAPKPIFVGAEDGTAQLDVARFPSPTSLQDVRDAVHVLTNEKHDYETVVFDSLGWIEPLIWAHVCTAAGVATIEEVGGGYGKGYTAAVDHWRTFLASLERLRKAKPMHVIFLAHTHAKTFKNPTGEDYDRYVMNINEKAAGPIYQWCDAVLFANWETFIKEDKKSKRVKGVGVGARIVYTERAAAWDAKNRYNLPEELPLSWVDFEAAVRAGAVAPVVDLKAEIIRKAAELGGETEKKILETLEKAGDDARSLALINNKCNVRISEKGVQQ